MTPYPSTAAKPRRPELPAPRLGWLSRKSRLDSSKSHAASEPKRRSMARCHAYASGLKARNVYYVEVPRRFGSSARLAALARRLSVQGGQYRSSPGGGRTGSSSVFAQPRQVTRYMGVRCDRERPPPPPLRRAIRCVSANRCGQDTCSTRILPQVGCWNAAGGSQCLLQVQKGQNSTGPLSNSG